MYTYPIVQSEVILDTEELKNRTKDPRRCKPIVFNKTGYELLKLCNEVIPNHPLMYEVILINIIQVKELLPLITLPVLIMHGEDDQVTLPKGIPLPLLR